MNHSILECYNLFSGVELSMRSFFVIIIIIIETLWVQINTGSKRKNIVICCAYRHPDIDATKFIEHFEHTLSEIDKNKVISILGDFNINLLNYETHSDTNNFLNSMISPLSSFQCSSTHWGY